MFRIGLDGDGDEEYWNEQFLGTDLTWYDVLSQPDGGNPWNTLARHYAAAYLNLLAGTDPADLLGIWLDFDGLRFTPRPDGSPAGGPSP